MSPLALNRYKSVAIELEIVDTIMVSHGNRVVSHAVSALTRCRYTWYRPVAALGMSATSIRYGLAAALNGPHNVTAGCCDMYSKPGTGVPVASSRRHPTCRGDSPTTVTDTVSPLAAVKRKRSLSTIDMSESVCGTSQTRLTVSQVCPSARRSNRT